MQGYVGLLAGAAGDGEEARERGDGGCEGPGDLGEVRAAAGVDEVPC